MATDKSGRLQIPPIATTLADPRLARTGPNGTDKTAKEWYYYWDQVGRRVNENGDLINELLAQKRAGGQRDEPAWVTDFVFPTQPAGADGTPGPPVVINDGASHPLSDYYDTLADAQASYPFAKDLTDELAWCAIQMAIYRSPYVYLPIGQWLINRPINCTNKEFGGVHFFGAGGQSQNPVVYTDLAIGADPTKVSSAAQPFGARHEWTVLTITGGDGFTAGKQVLITDVSSDGVATCATPVGAAGSTGGQAKSTTGCGSRIIARTNDIVFDCAGSGLLTFTDFNIDGASGTNNSTIGFLFARTYEQPMPESSLVYMARVVVVLRNFAHDGLGVSVNQCLNAGQYLGSIGVVNWCSENATFEHCYFQADRAYIGQNQLPMNICDDYPTTTDSDGLTHGQPLRFFLPKSYYATLYGSDIATPVHITNVSVSGTTVTYTTLEDLHDPALFHDLGGGSIGWYNNGGVTVRGVTGFSSVYPVNVTTRLMTLIDSHHFSIELYPYEPAISGAYAGGGTAMLHTWFSEGMDTIISCAFIAMGGPAVTLGGVGMFNATNIYTLSYHPTVNPNAQAPFQIVGQSYGIYLIGSSEMTSRVLYSRYPVYELRINILNPQDPDNAMARVWLDGQLPDPEGAVLAPAIIVGYIRMDVLYGTPVHHLVQSGPITGTLAFRCVLATNQDLGLDGGSFNIQVENSETWNPRMPQFGGVFDFASYWGRREIAGPLTLGGPIYSKDSAFRVNGIVGADTDAMVAAVDPTDPITIHTFANHGLVEGQKVSLYGAIGAAAVESLPCHVVSPDTIEVPGVSNLGATYFGGGYVRALGKAAYLALYDAGTVTWFLMKGASGDFVLLDERVNRSCILFARDFASIGGQAIAYTDLVIGADNTTVTSASKPFWSPLNVGQTLNIAAAPGWIVQTVTILSVDANNVATCDHALGTPGSTGGIALNLFTLSFLGDFITLPKQAAPSGTLNYLAVNDSGTVLGRTKEQSQSDLGIGGGGGSGGDAQVAYAGANLTLTTAAQVAVSLTLARAGKYLITGNFEFYIADASVGMRGDLIANGVAQGQWALVTGAVNTFSQATQQWIFQATAAGQVVAIRGWKDSGSGGSQLISGSTSISAIWISP